MKQLLIILSILFLASCSNDDLIIDNQIQGIEAYIATNYGAEYDGFISDGVYRYIGGNAFEDERERTLIGDGDHVRINFEEYMFSGSPVDAPFFTNKPEIAYGLPFDISTWTLEPLDFEIGNEAMLSAVEDAMIGCHRGDSIQVFITSDNAYGKHYFGIVPDNTALMFKIEIK